MVLHTGNEPPANWTLRPPANVVGRWRSNGSCVAISSDCVLTTTHQGGGVGAEVVIGNETYYVSRIESCGGDVRVAKLRLADLGDYVSPYANTDEAGKQIVIGGYGKGRGQEMLGGFLGNTVYGYQWAATGNTTLRWGTNLVDSIETVNDYVCIKADFDAPNSQGSTQYEAIIAEYDSGCGWFINSAGGWQVAGLSFSVQTHDITPNESRFKNPTTGFPAADVQYAHRISEYSQCITTTADRLANCGSEPADINEDCLINTGDLKEFTKWWSSPPLANSNRDRADVDGDSEVNMLDFSIIAKNWNKNYW